MSCRRSLVRIVLVVALVGLLSTISACERDNFGAIWRTDSKVVSAPAAKPALGSTSTSAVGPAPTSTEAQRIPPSTSPLSTPISPTVSVTPTRPTTTVPTTTSQPSTTLPTTTTAPITTTSGWRATVYFTPRDTNYPGAPRSISGCEDYCAPGTEKSLGSYSNAFLDVVVAHGTGYITSGAYTGQYLNWSTGVGGTGYWISALPRSASGAGLVAFASAAATGSLSMGTRFRIAACGRNVFGGSQNMAVCQSLISTTFTVIDRFEPGAATASRQVDLYLGVEPAGERFDASPFYISWDEVVLGLL